MGPWLVVTELVVVAKLLTYVSLTNMPWLRLLAYNRPLKYHQDG